MLDTIMSISSWFPSQQFILGVNVAIFVVCNLLTGLTMFINSFQLSKSAPSLWFKCQRRFRFNFWIVKCCFITKCSASTSFDYGAVSFNIDINSFIFFFNLSSFINIVKCSHFILQFKIKYHLFLDWFKNNCTNFE